MIEFLLEKHLPELHSHFVVHNTRAEMYASEWIFGLFSSVVPLELMGEFYSCFFAQRWIYFYKLVLTILKTH